MTQCNTLKVKLPNLQVNRLKPVIKISTEVTFKLLSNVVDNPMMRKILQISHYWLLHNFPGFVKLLQIVH